MSGVRQLACSAIHDHVKLWQYFCEKMLRVQFNITPNPNIQEFSGLRPGLGHYDFRNGLPKPPLKLISERERYLEDWYNAFNAREKRLGNTSNSVSHLTELYKIRKVSGNKKGFRTLLAKAVLNGDSEASYLYSLDLVSDPDEPRNRKKMAESLIKQLAHRGYPLAVKLCEKINLKPNYENVDLKSLVTKDLEEPSFRKNKQRLITLDKIKDDSIKQKLRPNSDRPFVGLYINEFEKLFSEYELNSSELKMVQKELSRRTQNARVKKLSDEVSNKLK